MASEVAICNRALQKLGSSRIASLSEDSVAARACLAAYTIIRDAELEAHPWNFAIERAELAADASAPDWGRANAFTLPTDFLRLLPDYPEDNFLDQDYQIEGRKILTDADAPLYIRYVARVEDTGLYPALFVEALATKLAFELCETLTQSNTKKEALRADYEAAIAKAKRTNAIQNVAQVSPDSDWITRRS